MDMQLQEAMLSSARSPLVVYVMFNLRLRVDSAIKSSKLRKATAPRMKTAAAAAAGKVVMPRVEP